MRIGASSPMRLMSSELVRAPARVRDDTGSGLILRTSPSQRRQRSNSRFWRHIDVRPVDGVLGVARARQVVPARGLEIFPAVLAVAHARPVPAVDEDPVDPVAGHDLLLHLRHELEVVGPQPAGDPHLGRRPVAPGLAVGGPPRSSRDAPPLRRHRSHGDRCGPRRPCRACAIPPQAPRRRRGRQAMRSGGETQRWSDSRPRSPRRSGTRRRSGLPGNSRTRTAG